MMVPQSICDQVLEFQIETIGRTEERFVDSGKMNSRVMAELVDMTGNLLVQSYLYVYASDEVARDVEHKFEVNVPATWWDAFKLHFAPCWWLRWLVARSPVQYRTIVERKRTTVTVHAFLPGAHLCGSKMRFRWSGGEPAYVKCKRCGAVDVIKSENIR